ncbi:hypothetical protein GC175_33890 [bacterium]|nr:hypothetical protein [bacterium]
MPQQPTDHPPIQTADLPFTEQVLIRLDEIISLLDQIAQCLQDGAGSTVRESVELSPAEVLGEGDLVHLLMAVAEHEERSH